MDTLKVNTGGIKASEAQAGTPKRGDNSPTRAGSPQKIPADGFFKLDKNEQYDLYKREDGKELNDELSRLNLKKREISNGIRSGTAAINKTGAEIKMLGDQLKDKKAERTSAGAEADVIDEEEFVLLKQERDAKRIYRTQMQELKELKKALSITKKAALRAKAALLDAFNIWFQDQQKYAPQTEDVKYCKIIFQYLIKPKSDSRLITSLFFQVLNLEDDMADVLDYGEQFDEMERTRVRVLLQYICCLIPRNFYIMQCTPNC